MIFSYKSFYNTRNLFKEEFKLNIKKVLREYKNYLDYENNVGYPSTNTRDLDDIASDLEQLLKVKENFLEVKDVIFTMESYPVFIHCSKLYKEEFYEHFSNLDASIKKKLLAFLINKMVYHNADQLFDAITDYNLYDVCKINDKDTFYNNKLVAMNYYSNLKALEINHVAAKYIAKYREELECLKTLNTSNLITGFFNHFLSDATYHYRLRLINELYVHLESKFKNSIKRIIEIGLNSNDEIIKEYRDEFEYLDFAFRYKNNKL